ncbi:MAG TPA: hypothetical protein DCE42_25970 [Myxococcales bacterium]|nr:hypothetical protein [Deltaproteobacteria bacterium]HAA58238.1 hypothetical protein [Myxococcales bacterium]|tara:strand:- start:4767 stop:5666 length:900 start_codon:yes stop_codon:yes gene_type:complete
MNFPSMTKIWIYSLSCFITMTLLSGCKKDIKPTPRPIKRSTSKPTKPKVKKELKKKVIPPKKVVRKAPPKPRKIDFNDYLNKPPKGFVALKEYIPGIRLSIRYHTPRNFTEAPLPGYGAPGAWMVEKAAKALKRVHMSLKKKGLGLLVYDAYRPIRGTLGMVAWAKRTQKLHLFKQGYIARYSGHNHGHTVDLTIVNLKTGKPLDMGTPWDTLTTKSHTRNAKGKALKNRYLLKREMRKQGFRPYYKEWWHFRYPMKGTKRRDVPYGCYEAPEGKWRPKKGWDKPGYNMPMKWKPSPCK